MKLKKSDYLDVPHGNSTVWRYMNLWKLDKLLSDSALFFPNAIKLSDQYEVAVPRSSITKKRNELESKGITGRDLEDEMASFYWQTNPMKELVLINCWSVNQYESYALWKIYLGGNKNGVAIRSTVSNLRKSVEKGNDSYPEDFFIGKVKYKKHLNNNELSRFSVITTKKPFYDFEKELRLFILNYPLSEGGQMPPYSMGIGRNVRVDLPILIKEVFISPFADETFKKDVQLKLSQYGLSAIPIKDSEIRDK